MVWNTVIRQARPDDLTAVVLLVLEVVNETYGHLFSDSPLVPTDPDYWSGCWVAERDGTVVGVGLAEGDYIEDLWVAAQFRGQQIGAALLSKLEEQIEFKGYYLGRLRVVAENEGAKRFYARQGWRENKSYPHERKGFLMVDFQKNLGSK